MSERPYLLITASIFGILAVAHFTRLLFHWPLVLGGWSVPLWISLPGLLVPGAFCVWGFRLVKSGRSA